MFGNGKSYPPVTYIRPQVLTNTLLTTAIGFVLAVVGLFLAENLDITLRFPMCSGTVS